MQATATSRAPKPPAVASSSSPVRVKAIPAGSENGCGRRSV